MLHSANRRTLARLKHSRAVPASPPRKLPCPFSEEKPQNRSALCCCAMEPIESCLGSSRSSSHFKCSDNGRLSASGARQEPNEVRLSPCSKLLRNRSNDSHVQTLGSRAPEARSQARQRYQLAMERQGCQRWPRFSISAAVGRSAGVTLSAGFSLPKVRAKPLRTP